MKDNKDVARGFLKKAESDLENLKMMMESGKSLDTACFHAQQTAEKYLKAFLCFHGVIFPKTHDIEELLDLCAAKGKQFSYLIEESVFLTDYAVELRYDFEFWPQKEDVELAYNAANKIKKLVLSFLPKEIHLD
jgi:HEPN domain-containing protein